jgi:DNA-binding MarR family transcriptional regulator
MPAPESEENRSDSVAKTITLSGRDIEDATRLLRLLAGEAKETGNRSTQWLLSRARKIIRNRELRTTYFNPAMFGEGPWDILLVLYVTDASGARQTRASLAKRLAMPSSTVHRWIDYLEKERFVQRDAHPTDKRTNFVRLLDKGRKAMDEYLVAIAD